MTRTYKGMILAAGLGTRLFPLTRFLAKPAIPFLNVPLINYSINMLRSAGIREIAVNLHHQPDAVKSALGSSEPSIHFSYEKEILGTAGGIRALQGFFGDSPIVLSNGKIYFEDDLKEAIEVHQKEKALVTMIVVPRMGNEEFNPVLVDSRSRVAGFHRGYLPPGNQSAKLSRFVYTGVQIIEPEVRDQIPEGVSDTVKDIYPALIASGRIRAFVSQNYWCECSTPERYLYKSLEVLNRNRIDNLSRSVLNGSCKSVISGTNVHVPESTSIKRAILWDRIIAGENCSISDSIIIGGPISIPDGFRIEESIVTPLISDCERTVEFENFEEHGITIWPLRQY